MKGYRTVAFNAVLAVMAVISALVPEAKLPQGAALEAIFSLGWEALLALCALGNILLRAVTDTPMFISNSGEDVQSKANSSLLVGLATLMLAFTLFGCSSIRSNPASAQLVTQYAVAKYLEGKKTDQARYDAAVRIVKIAGDLRVVTGGMEARLDSLRVFVLGAVAAQPLSPADRILANGLAELLLSEVELRLKNGGVLQPDQVVIVNDLLSWVIAVAMTVPNPSLERPT